MEDRLKIDITKLAQQAQIELSEAEEESLGRELEAIVGRLGVLGELEPLRESEETLIREGEMPLRGDVRVETFGRDEALTRAPRKSEFEFRVPVVVE